MVDHMPWPTVPVARSELKLLSCLRRSVNSAAASVVMTAARVMTTASVVITLAIVMTTAVVMAAVMPAPTVVMAAAVMPASTVAARVGKSTRRQGDSGS
ncbi:MAG: hypothetical protein JWM53_3473 [bacterium]|nr:hypothetical protein [bacterium]